MSGTSNLRSIDSGLDFSLWQLKFARVKLGMHATPIGCSENYSNPPTPAELHACAKHSGGLATAKGFGGVRMAMEQC